MGFSTETVRRMKAGDADPDQLLTLTMAAENIKRG